MVYVQSLNVSPADLYFLIQWLEDDENDLFHAVPGRDITPAEDGDVLSLVPGQECRASFGNQLYPARVVAVGKWCAKYLSVCVCRDVCVNIVSV